MTDFSLRVGDTAPALVATLRNDDGTAVDLTNASVATLTMRKRSAATLAINGGAMTIVSPRTSGQVRYAWGTTDTQVGDIGAYWAVVNIGWSDGSTQSFPNPDLIVIDILPDLANMPVISDADLALIRALVGTEPSDFDLATLLAPLGSTDAVALSVLEGRLMAALAEPEEYSLDGDLRVKWGVEGRKMLQAKVDELKRRTGTYTYMPVPVSGGMTWSDRDPDPDVIPAYFSEDMDNYPRRDDRSRRWDNRSG
jgi:hypothetical protein